MKLYIPNTSKQSLGGGWTFLRNFRDANTKIEIVKSWQECDVVLIIGATMTSRDEMIQAKAAGKKIVFRVDNIPKDSRNRGTAFSRMLDFAKMSDAIIFQSEWAKDYAGWWFKDNGVEEKDWNVICNGINPTYFYDKNIGSERKSNRYLFVQYNRDENKRQTEAFYMFHQAFRQDKTAELYLVGQFSPELSEYGFDFFAGERVTYLGVIDNPSQMGEIMRQCQYLLFPAYADAAPNTVLEAVSCGCEVLGINPIGGSAEMVKLKGRTIHQMTEEYYNVFNKLISK